MLKRGTGSSGGDRGEADPSGRRATCVVAALAAALLGGRAYAAEPCASVVGHMASVEGVVQVRGEAEADWRAAELGIELCRQDTVRTGDLSRAAIALVTDEILRLDQGTTLRLAEVPLEASEPSVLELVFGVFQSFSRSPRRVDVGTPHMTLAIRGTEFVVRADQGESVLTVTEGEVVASNAQGELAVPSGQSAVARPGQAPQPYLLVRPRDAVQWSLYYPADPVPRARSRGPAGAGGGVGARAPRRHRGGARVPGPAARRRPRRPDPALPRGSPPFGRP
ncbi:MAG TPA: FecR family protein, partial [Geminicoccaceae bacterium]|nr:FecR family protein [Geminicoccaceae bacterium]